MFRANPKSKKPRHSLLIPPPNLTGGLHLGHAMQHAILDAVARFKRLQGYDVLLLPGVDHAGIQFEATFDKELKKKNLSKEKLGREKWLEMAWDFKEEVYKSVSSTWRFLGLSADWSREVFTLDEGPKRAVFEVFKNFYDKGLLYKGPYIVQWCPKCNTAIEDVEMEYEERREKLYYLKYGPLVLATVRPETKFGDTAMAVNSKDPRYKKYVGREFEIETLAGKRKMKIIADDAVDPKFGTGVIKVAPGHDFVDYEIGKRHNLPILQTINKQGRLTELAGKYAGMKVLEAREVMIPDLKKKGLLVKEEDYTHNVAVCERCKSVVEPLISEEWFVKVGTIAKEAITTINRDEIKFLPKNYEKILVEWLKDIHDWCISRSLWWGHRIPVWYCNPKDTKGRKLGFAQNVVSQIFAGKTKTYRLRDHEFKIGDLVAFENSQSGKIFGYGTITDIDKTTVGKLFLNDPAHGAMYKRRSQLIAAFKRHYPDREINNNTPVLIYTYKFSTSNKTREWCNEIIVSLNKPKACPKCGNTEIVQDEQVLDTWFSSGLWPISTLGWPHFAESNSASRGKPSITLATEGKPDLDPDLKKYFPWDFEISAPEIKYLWIARMIMLSKYFTDKIPFKTMFFHGMLRDLQGRKFSKSLGNGIDPLDLINQWGVDATRMALYTYSIPGRDGRVSRELLDERCKNFRNFGTKMRNVARFILELRPSEDVIARNTSTSLRVTKQSKDRHDPSNGSRDDNEKVMAKDDLLILDELNKTAKKVTANLEKIELHLAVEELYNFVWHSLADKYIEKSKERREDAQPVLEHVLKQVLILLHPFMPFTTEEIYQMFETKQKSILLERWPSA